ncbi:MULTISPECIES: hypothetical protein [unclassified Coleofasciculus]|uniref:hypothetical protein n=1 Tax=unclassified Coleofasciculus TaxID=2692782 RepID=UPI001D155A3F|nr:MULTISPECIES: hypothetical protein [unclassified Coleofasciculus]
MDSQPHQNLESVSEPTPVLPSVNSTNEKATYGEKTNRIQALSELLKSVIPFVWVAVILIVIIPLIGRGFIGKSMTADLETSSNKTSKIVVIEKTLPDSTQIDQAIATAITDAHTQAEHLASERLDEWVDGLMTRVDSSFLNWYFDYFNQKKLEFTTPFIWLSSAAAHWINTTNPPPSQVVAEKVTEDFQTEFAKRVLRPKIAQLELERITRDTINLYVAELGKNISRIQSSYKIPQGQWERYLEDIAITIADTEGNISNLSLKVLVGGSTYLFAKAMIPVAAKIGSKVAVSFAGKSAAKMAAKTGGTVAGKLGAQFLDPIVAVGIIIWDVWDYQHTVKVERPILQEAIRDYLQEVKASLLDNPENGIMAAIDQLEGGILKSVNVGWAVPTNAIASVQRCSKHCPPYMNNAC